MLTMPKSNSILRYSAVKRSWRHPRGSVLILSLIFLIAISVVIGALATWTMNDLNNTTNFNNSRAMQYSASSAVNVAMQSIRYFPCDGIICAAGTPPATALGECWVPTGGLTFSQLVTEASPNNVAVAVWCSTTENLSSANTRVVSLYACPSTLSGTSPSGTISAAAAACAASPTLYAQVTFDDYPPNGSPLLTSQCATPNCGEGVTLNTWKWG
jgi:hypothetical protein